MRFYSDSSCFITTITINIHFLNNIFHLLVPYFHLVLTPSAFGTKKKIKIHSTGYINAVRKNKWRKKPPLWFFFFLLFFSRFYVVWTGSLSTDRWFIITLLTRLLAINLLRREFRSEKPGAFYVLRTKRNSWFFFLFSSFFFLRKLRVFRIFLAT